MIISTNYSHVIVLNYRSILCNASITEATSMEVLNGYTEPKHTVFKTEQQEELET